MKYVDEYRNDRIAKRLVNRILDRATQRWVVMDVCGGQTHGLVRHGIEQSLIAGIELIIAVLIKDLDGDLIAQIIEAHLA